MRFRLIILFSVISFSAPAQVLGIHFHFARQHPVLPPLPALKSKAARRLTLPLPSPAQLSFAVLPAGELDLEAEEAVIMRKVKHNMSWRIYNEASYNFSDLAGVYIRLHRLSEAKWYLLQSNTLSRRENDDPHTISNLISLASVKTDIGDPESARTDLLEAQGLASSRGLREQMAEIEGKLRQLDRMKTPVPAKFANAN